MELTTLRLKTAHEVGAQGLGRLWRRLEREGAVRTLFYDGGVRSEHEFARFALNPARLFYAVLVEGRPAALFWLDNWTGQAAFIHFAVLRRAWGRAARIIGRYVTAWLLRAEREGGGPLVRTLIGLTPDTHPLAVRFARDIGFSILGRVPHALTLADGRAAAAIVSTLTREEVQDGWIRHGQVSACDYGGPDGCADSGGSGRGRRVPPDAGDGPQKGGGAPQETGAGHSGHRGPG